MVNNFLNENPSMSNNGIHWAELRVVMDSFQGIPLSQSECPKSQQESILKKLSATLSSISYQPYKVEVYGGTVDVTWKIPMPYLPKKFLKKEMKRLHKNLAIYLRKMGIEFSIMYFDGKFVMYEWDEKFNCLYDHAKDEDFFRTDKTTTPTEEFYDALGFEIVVNKK